MEMKRKGEQRSVNKNETWPIKNIGIPRLQEDEIFTEIIYLVFVLILVFEFYLLFSAVVAAAVSSSCQKIRQRACPPLPYLGDCFLAFDFLVLDRNIAHEDHERRLVQRLGAVRQETLAVPRQVCRGHEPPDDQKAIFLVKVALLRRQHPLGRIRRELVLGTAATRKKKRKKKKHTTKDKTKRER